MLNIVFSKDLAKAEVKVVFLDEGLKVSENLIPIDHHSHGLISKTVKDNGSFSGKFGQIKVYSFANKDSDIEHLIILGLGKVDELTESKLEKLGGRAITQAAALKAKTVAILPNAKMGNFDINAAGPLIAGGALLASYRFEKYFTTKKEEEKFSLNNIEILATDINGATRDYLIKKSIVMGVFLARNCVSEPPNVLYPESYAEIIAKELETEGVEVEILGEREMRNLGMGALLGVGQGSNNESKLVVMKYFGSSEDKVHAAFVGKGVTFDTGGISIKPANGMEQMKYDMAGSAAVVGAIKALALRKAKANVVGVVGLVENMPGSKAQRPSDVVKTMSGKTAEVLNTDAEGRLVLADAIWYAQEKFNPECVVDLATLTGAIVVALGNTYGGLFANNDDLANKLIDSGGKIDEKLWRMPLHKDYDDIIKSDIADVANIASVPGVAGSATAAHFIGRFIKNDTPWAHLDIAGMAWEKKGKEICPRGATGYGVRLLNQFIWDNYERK